MGYGAKIIVSGEYALFSRPEMKVERVSYDVPTPSALVGLISNIYWPPGVKYIIDRIVVYKPVAFVNIRRNEVKDKLSESDVVKQMNGKKDDISIDTSESRTQRASMILKNVKYGVEFHFELTEAREETLTPEKCYNILLRRLRKGQFYCQPCLGCREFPAAVILAENLEPSTLEGDVDLGYMLYEMKYKTDKNGKPSDNADPVFYRPHMINGEIDVRRYAKELQC